MYQVRHHPNKKKKKFEVVYTDSCIYRAEDRFNALMREIKTRKKTGMVVLHDGYEVVRQFVPERARRASANL